MQKVHQLSKTCMIRTFLPHFYFKSQSHRNIQVVFLSKLFPFCPINNSFVMATNRYCIDLAKRGTAACKECKVKIEKGIVRIAKIVPNPFTDEGGEMKHWFHVRCAFEKLSRARATTKKIESTDDLEGWDAIAKENQAEVLKVLAEFSSTSGKKAPQKPTPKKVTPKNKNDTSSSNNNDTSGGNQNDEKDNSFREFRKLCNKISDEPKYLSKTAIISDFFSKGTDGKSFKGDIYLWVRMLLPTVNKKVFNLQSKQLVKLFSQIFNESAEEMLESLEEGDVAETIRIFFEQSEACQPAKKSTLSLFEVETFLNELARFTKEEEQIFRLKKVAKKCTGNDLKIFVRLIKHDLRINAGPKPILDAIHPKAYEAFQASQNLEDVVRRSLKLNSGESSQNELSVQTSLMTPVLPMLAQVCESITAAFQKCPNGMLVEIKYDGERVQIHKSGNEFSYFSRSLKPVLPHKVNHLKEYIPKAFPTGNDLILDSEILLVDKTGKPLPFGTLGAHKKAAFKDATVCLFVFDCLQFNDENLMKTPLSKRRSILLDNITPIKNRVICSEMKPIKDPKELEAMIHSVKQQGLEGLMIKDKKGIYEPGKRHWLKMKKDPREGGMLDSADLVVLGAYYGTGNKGGMMSIFLMGCYNERTQKWCTVTKVHGGHDDSTLERLQSELDMIKIGKDPLKVPPWLHVNKPLIPDFISVDPKKSQVWEITGAEFTKTENHTADGVSIRFPRVTKIRDDKTWKTATTLKELLNIYNKSKTYTDLIGLSVAKSNDDDDDDGNKNDDDGNENADDAYESMEDNENEEEQNKPSTSGMQKKNSPASKRKSLEPSPPSKKRSSPSDKEVAAKRMLPNVFTGVKLYIPSSIEKVDLLRRYFVAYDGRLLPEESSREANIVICSDEKKITKSNEKIKQVTPDWLWDCIKLRKRLPINLYAPKT